MIGPYVRPTRTLYSREQAVIAYWDACTALGMHPTVPLVTVLVAHGALETGNFQTGCWLSNVGNIKASEAWSGSYTCITLNEILKNKTTGKLEECWFAPEGELTGDPKKGGKLKAAYLANPIPVPSGHPQTRMRAYSTLAQGVEDKIRFFLKPAWEPCLKPARLGDASGYVRAIRVRNYFTAYKGQPDPTRYELDVISLCNTYRPIVQLVASGNLKAVPVEVTPVATPPRNEVPSRFVADDEWRALAFKAYEQALAMDVHEIVRKEALKELRED